MTVTLQEIAEAARIMREAVKDKSYRSLPLGMEAGHYLRSKRKRLTPASYRDYESSLDKLARFFADVELWQLEPPTGTERLEEYLEHQWGAGAGRTYNKNLSILRDFFKWAVLRGKIHGDPTLPIERAKGRATHRTTFTTEQRQAIISCQAEARDRVAVRLLLDYGIRKGTLQQVRFEHFDHYQRRITIFTKGDKIRVLPLPHPPFWLELEQLILETEAKGAHFLMQRQKTVPRVFEPGTRKTIGYQVLQFPELPMGAHGLHSWWYGCLERAGVVEVGTTSGERMHKARHTAGQRVLDKTGNLKAVQKLLGHETIKTTADIYTDWDLDQLAETMLQVIDE